MKFLSRLLVITAFVFAGQLAKVEAGGPNPLFAPPAATQGNVVTYGTQPNIATDGGVGVGTSGHKLCAADQNCVTSGNQTHNGTETTNGTENHGGTENHSGGENHTGAESHTGNESHSGVLNSTGSFQQNGISQTFPSSGSVAGTSDIQTLTNKDISAGTNAVHELTTSTFASGVIDPDPTLSANSNSKLATQSATKAYVDNASFGLSFKNPANIATTANITLSGEQTIDGVLTSSSRVLVKNQIDTTANGLYTSSSGAWVRTSDADTGVELKNATVLVLAGTLNAFTQWNCACASVTIGVTPVVFTQISGANSYTAGTGLQLTGNQFAIDGNVVTRNGNQTLTSKTLTAPIIATINNGGTLTLPTGAHTLMGQDTTDTMTNKSFTVQAGSTVVTLPNYGNRALSILDFAGVPNWSTDATTALNNALAAAAAANIHIVRLDPSSVGSGYKFTSIVTIPAGMAIYCPGAPYVQPASDDFRNMPNAVILVNSGGMKFSSGSGEFGNCNFLPSNLANAAPPTDIQGSYARRAAFTGTAFQCLGDGCYYQGGSAIGFTDIITQTGSRSYIAIDIRADGTNCFHSKQALENRQQIELGLSCQQYATTTSAPGTTVPPVNLDLSTLADNGGGELRATFLSSCGTTNCPLNGMDAYITNSNGAQSAQGRWILENVSTTFADLAGSSSAYLTGATVNATINNGDPAVNVTSAMSSQIKQTQSVSGACIPANDTIVYVKRSYKQFFLAVPPTCHATEDLTITDSSGNLSIDKATVVAGGLSYQVGDTLTVLGGTVGDGPAILTVKTVDGNGAVLAVDIFDGGDYSVLPSNPASTSGGSGDGNATFNVSSDAQLLLTANTRSGVCFLIEKTTDVIIHDSHCYAHATCALFQTGSTRVHMSAVDCDDSSGLQDDTRVGIHFTGTANKNVIDGCRLDNYTGHGIVDDTSAGSKVTGNAVSHCVINDNSGSGFNKSLLEVESSAPGTPKKSSFIFSDNQSATSNAGWYISEDVTNVAMCNNQLGFSTPYFQSRLAKSITYICPTDNFLGGYQIPTNAPKTAISANSGGVQAGATLLPSLYNQVSSCDGTDGYSVLLLPAAAHWHQIVNNVCGHAIQVFGTDTDTINGVASGTGVSQPSGTVVDYVSFVNGEIRAQPSSLSINGVTCPLGTACVAGVGPVYDSSGTLKTGYHMVVAPFTLSGGTATITLSGAAIFTNVSSYQCNANDGTTSPGTANVHNSSGSSFVIRGTGTNTGSVTCTGN